MNWRRIHREWVDSKHFKEWIGGRGCYRIIWRDQAYGVTIAPGYHTLVKVDGIWDLINPGKRLKRTLKAAKRACELHAT